jgi:hypothetical protein
MAYVNTGRLDRAIRLVLGLVVLGLYGASEPPLKYFTLLGLPLLATGLSGFCPLYRVLGISTRRGSGAS